MSGSQALRCQAIGRKADDQRDQVQDGDEEDRFSHDWSSPFSSHFLRFFLAQQRFYDQLSSLDYGLFQEPWGGTFNWHPKKCYLEQIKVLCKNSSTSPIFCQQFF